MYRAVRMRLEVNRLPTSQQAAFTRAAFRQIKQCLRTSVSSNTSLNNKNNELTTLKSTTQPSKMSSSLTTSSSTSSSNDIQECCICLYNMLPGQALFIAPCSHIYHYKCLRPILMQNFPGFSCPLCRSYADLDASVTIDKEEVESMLKLFNEDNNINNIDNSNNNNNNEIITEESITNNDNDNNSSNNNNEALSDLGSDPSSDTDMDISNSRSSELISNQNPRQQQKRKSNSNGIDYLLSSTLVGSPPQFEILISPHPALPTTTTTTTSATTSQITTSFSSTTS